jgi:hypothetical protein
MEQSVRRIMTTFGASFLALLGVVLLSEGTLLWGILLVLIGGGLVLLSLLASSLTRKGHAKGVLCFYCGGSSIFLRMIIAISSYVPRELSLKNTAMVPQHNAN